MGRRLVDQRTPPHEWFFRLQLELRLAAALQERLGKQPRLFLLAVMMLGLLLSAAISNVTAPVLLLAVVQPLLQEQPS